MQLKISDREVLSVLAFLRTLPGGEDAMERGLRLYEIFNLGAARWPGDGPIIVEQFSDTPVAYELDDNEIASLRAILARPGQAPDMWLASARALRHIRAAVGFAQQGVAGDK